METATRLAKRIVAYPENSVPYISTREYVGRYAKDPRRSVCFPCKINFRDATHTFA